MRVLALLLLLPLAACATGRAEPVSLVKRPLYQAVGGPPGWTLAVARERIVLRLAPERDGEAALVVDFPSPRANYGGGVKSWSAGAATRRIEIEARRGPCARGAARFQDEVRVRWNGRALDGCGGRLLPGGRG